MSAIEGAVMCETIGATEGATRNAAAGAIGGMTVSAPMGATVGTASEKWAYCMKVLCLSPKPLSYIGTNFY